MFPFKLDVAKHTEKISKLESSSLEIFSNFQTGRLKVWKFEKHRSLFFIFSKLQFGSLKKFQTVVLEFFQTSKTTVEIPKKV